MIRHLGENWNLSTLSFHHAFPCFYNELISLVQSVGSLSKIDLWIMPRVESLKLDFSFKWIRQVKNAQPCWCLTVVHHQQSNMKLHRSYPGNIWTFAPQQRRQFVITQNVPRLWKVDPEVTTKTTFDCISDLIQSERDLSPFTNPSYSKYSINDTHKVIFFMGKIGQVCFKRFGGTLMEETIWK